MVGIVQTIWQDLLTIAVATVCAAWVLWTTLAPFVRRTVSACGTCPSCDPATDAVPSAAAETPPEDLLQIAPLDPPR